MRQLIITQNITRRDGSLNAYLQEISKLPLISAEEEIELAAKIKKGDSNALNKMVNSNLRFVVSVAKQYQNQGIALSDLINEGNVGLIKAAQKFDATKGFKFISYAVWWIRQSILQAIAEQSRMVRLPMNQVGLLTKIRNTIAEFEQLYQRKPSIDELSEILDMDAEKIKNALNDPSKPMSIDAPMGDDDNNAMIDTLQDKDTPSTDQSLMDESLSVEVEAMLAGISARERQIIKLCYGISCKEMTTEEIGQKLNITKERVRQIKDQAIRKLRQRAFNGEMNYD